MEIAWRVIKSRHASNYLSGMGAAKAGGRWTSPGIEVIHFSDTLSLALLEVIVHANLSNNLSAYKKFQINIPEEKIESVAVAELPVSWRDYPAPLELKDIGDKWFNESRSEVLRLPSVIIPEQYTYIVNPHHKDFASLKISQPITFEIDQRLAKTN